MGKIIRSFAVAFTGMGFAIRTQSHMRFHLAAAVVVSSLAAFVGLSPLEWAVLLLTIAVVITLEMVNTAVEQVVDLASPDVHPLAKTAKDVAAGAVLIASVISAVIGLLILGPPLWHFMMK